MLKFKLAVAVLFVFLLTGAMASINLKKSKVRITNSRLKMIN